MNDRESARRYTIAISKGSALVDEMKRLLRAWEPGEPVGEFCDRVISEDILGKSSARRSQDIARRVFANRFLLPTDAPARRLRLLLEADLSPRAVSDLCMLYSARNDLLLRDAITKVYWPGLNEGRLSLTVDDFVRFIRQADAEGLIPVPWSDAVAKKIARALVKSLVEYGLLREEAKGRRETVPYRAAPEALVYLAYDLRSSGLSDQAILDHDDWMLYGFDRSRLVTELDSSDYGQWWLLQIAGSVARFSWKHESVDEVVDVLAE